MAGRDKFLKRWQALGMALIICACWQGAARAQLDTQVQTPVPAYWVSYAQLVSNRLIGWLDDGNNQTALNLHRYLEKRTADPSAATSPAMSDIVHVWVAPDGSVAKVAFESLGDAKADDELRQLLTQGRIGEAPPADMPQPLVLRLSLKRNP